MIFPVFALRFLLLSAGIKHSSSQIATLENELFSQLLESGLGAIDKDVVAVVPEKTNGSSEILPMLAKADIPFAAMTPEAFPLDKDGQLSCQDSNEKSKDGLLSRGKLFLVLPFSKPKLENFLLRASGTVMECPLLVDPGEYRRQNAFLYIDNGSSLNFDLEKIVFADKEVKRHRQVGVVRRVDTESFLMVRFSYYTTSTVSMLMRRGSHLLPWALTRDLPMSGHQFTVTLVPYDSYNMADPVEDPIDPEHYYENLSGFEHSLLMEVAKALDFTCSFRNPADQLFGNIVNGSFNGLVLDILEGKADIMLTNGVFEERMKVIHSTSRYLDEKLVFVTKRPQRNHHDLFTLLRPLRPMVWMLVCTSFLFYPIAMCFFARIEGQFTGRRLMQFHNTRESYWNAFGTLLGQSITRKTKTGSHWGLRVAVATWIGYALVLTTGYGGNLRAFLMTPSFEEGINSFAGILSSGLPWEIGLYGEVVEGEMASSEHPVMKAIWDGKIPVFNEPFAYQRMGRIAEGKAVLIDWLRKMETTAFIAFMLPNGNTLLRFQDVPIVHSAADAAWGMSKLAPFAERFDIAIQAAVETGLVDHWRMTTMYQLKRWHGGGKERLLELIELVGEDDGTIKMGFSHFFGLYLLVVLLVAFASISMLLEAWTSKKDFSVPSPRSQVGNTAGSETCRD